MNTGSNASVSSSVKRETTQTQNVFVPFTEDLLEGFCKSGGISLDGSNRLVPFSLDYRCVRLMDGTYDFTLSHTENNLPKPPSMVHAA